MKSWRGRYASYFSLNIKMTETVGSPVYKKRKERDDIIKDISWKIECVLVYKISFLTSCRLKSNLLGKAKRKEENCVLLKYKTLNKIVLTVNRVPTSISFSTSIILLLEIIYRRIRNVMLAFVWYWQFSFILISLSRWSVVTIHA